MWSYNSSELIHFGIKGMKWGVRRYQNEDGSLTAAGKKKAYKAYVKYAKKQASEKANASYEKESQAKANYEAGLITKNKYDKTVFKETRKRSKIQLDLDNTLAEAKREYNLSRGKSKFFSDRKYKKAQERNASAFADRDIENIYTVAKNNQKVAQALVKSGDIKLSDLNAVNIAIGKEAIEAVAESSNKKRKS